MEQRTSYRDYIFSTGVIVEGIIFFFSEKENVLMEIDTRDWKVSYSEGFEECRVYCGDRADLLKAGGKKLYKLVLNGSSIEEFSLEDGGCKKMSLGCYDKQWDNFVAFEVHGQFLYVFPKWSKKVIKVNIDNYSKKDIALGDGNLTNSADKKRFTNFTAAFRVKNHMWLFEAANHKVDIFDMDKNTYTSKALPEVISDCVGICQNCDTFYILTIDSRIYSWKPKSGEFCLLWEEEKYKSVDYYFGQVIFACQRIILLPSLGDDIVIIDTRNGSHRCYDEYPEDFSYLDINWGKYINCFEDKDYIYFPMRLSSYLLVVGKNNGEIYWKKLIMPFKWEQLGFRVDNKYILDDKMSDLLGYLKVEKKGVVMHKHLIAENVGSDIWQKVGSL